jgi:hypothetical protein
MPTAEMMSCILCLEAFERPTMLEVSLRTGGAGPAPSHIICLKCGAAIAAEYLYREQQLRPQPPAKAEHLEHLEQPAPEPIASSEPAPRETPPEQKDGGTSA